MNEFLFSFIRASGIVDVVIASGVYIPSSFFVKPFLDYALTGQTRYSAELSPHVCFI